MSSSLTIGAITENMLEVLGRQGLFFLKKANDDKADIPASLLPAGQLFYKGEVFDATYGQRPTYVEARYLLKVIMREGSPDALIREQQRWCHMIRDALTVEALNINGLSASRLVSRVAVDAFEAHSRKDLSHLACNVTVRYREV